jgi:serine palmitoyltransferase
MVTSGMTVHASSVGGRSVALSTRLKSARVISANNILSFTSLPILHPKHLTMASATPKEIPPPLLPVLAFLSDIFETLRDLFHRIPGSPILLRYIKSSYQNDPYRSLLELFLVAFALRTVLKGRTRGEGSGKNWVKFTEKEVDELVDEWTPQPLVDAPSAVDEDLLESIPVIHGANGSHVKLAPGGKTVLNMALPNWAGMVESDKMKQVAIDTLREYGVGTCGPSGFYGTIGES